MSLKLRDKGLIFSPDFLDIEDFLEIIHKCRRIFSAIKVGNITLYRYGAQIISRIKHECSLPVICDFKLMDIPDIAERIMQIGLDNGMDGAMVWGMAGEETIYRCVKGSPEIMVFIVTEYTHSDEAIDVMTSDQAARIALDAGACGIQAPATRPIRIAQLRKIVGDDLKIISCGIGHQGASYGQAIRYGADFEIIGRSIYKAPDPVLEAEKAYYAIHGDTAHGS